ncbi:MAG: SulP family inorganic anion transporter [Candidatus Latescibacterota bacterium]|jgi:SulP family sulfate permease
MGVLRLGRYIRLVPNVVVSGFMNGIALLVWASQLRKLFGGPAAGAFDGPLLANTGVALITLGLIFLLPHLVERLPARLRHLTPPATLTALLDDRVCAGPQPAHRHHRCQRRLRQLG